MGLLVDKVDRLTQKCVIDWHSSKFEVLVEEEEAGWIPECLVDFFEQEASATGLENLAMEMESEKGLEEGEIAVEEHEIQLGPKETEPDNVVIQNGNVQEVISNQFTEGNRYELSKKKRRKYTRRKSPGKSPSHSDPGRPKKRQRDGSDPFDIDRFIFPEPNHLIYESNTGDQDGEFMPPDLNAHVELNEVVVEAGGTSDLDRPIIDQVSSPTVDVAQEVNETIALAKTLGAENLEMFEESLVIEIQKEGVQTDDQ